MESWKRRMIGEYAELLDCYIKLCAMLDKYVNGELDFTPDCPLELLQRQEKAMALYLQCLEERALYEGVSLPR